MKTDFCAFNTWFLPQNTFETDGKLFVVMERMHSDMLEMILNSSQGRLDERSTALLMVQVFLTTTSLTDINICFVSVYLCFEQKPMLFTEFY